MICLTTAGAAAPGRSPGRRGRRSPSHRGSQRRGRRRRLCRRQAGVALDGLAQARRCRRRRRRRRRADAARARTRGRRASVPLPNAPSTLVRKPARCRKSWRTLTSRPCIAETQRTRSPRRFGRPWPRDRPKPPPAAARRSRLRRRAARLTVFGPDHPAGLQAHRALEATRRPSWCPAEPPVDLGLEPGLDAGAPAARGLRRPCARRTQRPVAESETPDLGLCGGNGPAATTERRRKRRRARPRSITNVQTARSRGSNPPLSERLRG